MQVVVRRMCKDWNDYETEFIQMAANWCLEELEIDVLDDLVIIELHEMRIVDLAIVDEGYHGDAVYDIYDNTHTVRIWKTEGSLHTLFHELTHVRQQAEDELELYEMGAFYKGEKYEDWDYWSAPWEVEARHMEEVLFHKFQKEVILSW